MSHAHAMPTAVTEPCRSNQEPGASAPERRGRPRIDLHVGIGFHNGSRFYTGFTADISEGGLFVASHMLQPVGSELTLTFALPSGPEISVRAAVRWAHDTDEYDPANPPGMGVQFLNLGSADAERIAELVALRPPVFFVS